MAIRAEWIRYGDGLGYFAAPEHGAKPLPSVIVIQEIGGVNGQIEETTRRIAAAGYAALAPDLFAKGGRRPPHLTRERFEALWAFSARLAPGTLFNPQAREQALAALPDQERRPVEETMRGMMASASPESVALMVPALRGAVAHLRADRPETKGKPVACVGFCMGGGLSALLACEEPDLAGAAVYYGMLPPEEKLAGIRCPVIGFFGEKDERVNVRIPAFEKAMKAAGKSFEHTVYRGAGHAFFNEDQRSYDVEATRDSFVRLLEFFRKVLSG